MRWLLGVGIMLVPLLSACLDSERNRAREDAAAMPVFVVDGFKLGQTAGEVRGLLSRKGIAIDEDNAPNVGIGKITAADSGFYTFINCRLIAYWPPRADIASAAEFANQAGLLSQRYGAAQSDKAQLPAGYGVSEALLASSAEIRFWHNPAEKQLLIMGRDRAAQHSWLELTTNTQELVEQVLGKMKGGKESPNGTTDED